MRDSNAAAAAARPPPPNDGEDDWEDRDVKRYDEDDDDDTPERRFRNAHRACSMAHAIDCSDSGDCDGCCYSALAETSTCPWAKPADGYLGVNERDVWAGCSCDETRYCKCMSRILGAPCSLLPKQCTAAGADAGCESYLTCTYGAADRRRAWGREGGGQRRTTATRAASIRWWRGRLTPPKGPGSYNWVHATSARAP